MTKRKTTEEFKKELEDKFPNQYLILSDYLTNKSKIKVKCLKCGNEYDGRPLNLLRGDRCPYCIGNKKLTTEEFKKRIKLLYNNEYILKSNYTNNNTKVTLFHNICKREYEVLPKNFLNGNRCPYCFGTFKLTNKEFQNKLDELYPNEYLLLSDYKTTDDYVTIKHLTCGNTFKATPHNLLGKRKQKCPCLRIYSKGENYISDYLTDNNINFQIQKKFDGCIYKGILSYDFYLKDYNLCIEYDGEQHFKPSFGVDELELNKKRDNFKNEFCRKNNIKLLRISYSEFNNIDIILDKYISSTTIENTIFVGVEYNSSELETRGTLIIEGKDIV